MVQVTVLILRIYMSLWRENYEMEVVLDQVWNRLSALFGNIFTVQYCNTHVVLTHSLFCMCTSQGQQLKYYTDGSSLLFYLFSWLFILLPFPLYLLYMHNSVSYTLRLFLLPEVASRVFAEQFSPSDDGAHIIDSGDTSATRKRQPFRNKPRGYQCLCEPGAPQVWRATALQVHILGWGGMLPKQHPARSSHPAKYYPLLDCVYACSSDLSKAHFI